MAHKEAGETAAEEAKAHSKGFLKKAAKEAGGKGKKESRHKEGKSHKGGKY